MNQTNKTIKCPICGEYHNISESKQEKKFYCAKCNIRTTDINESKLAEKVSKIKKLY